MRKSTLIFFIILYSVASFTAQDWSDATDNDDSPCITQLNKCSENTVCNELLTCFGNCADNTTLQCRRGCLVPAEKKNNKVFWQLHLCILQFLSEYVPDEKICVQSKCKNLKSTCLSQSECSNAIKCEKNCLNTDYESRATCIGPFGANIILHNYLKCREECIWKDLV